MMRYAINVGLVMNLNIFSIFFCVFFFRKKGNYLEFQYTVKIPWNVLNRSAASRQYKYHVESPGTERSLMDSREYIPDNIWINGKMPHRSLKSSKRSCDGKYFIICKIIFMVISNNLRVVIKAPGSVL